jgi:excisionase family DNA binding protein
MPLTCKSHLTVSARALSIEVSMSNIVNNVSDTQVGNALDSRLAFSIGEVARALGVSASFVRLEIGRGRMKVKRAGRRVLIPRQALTSYMAE